MGRLTDSSWWTEPQTDSREVILTYCLLVCKYSVSVDESFYIDIVYLSEGLFLSFMQLCVLMYSKTSQKAQEYLVFKTTFFHRLYSSFTLYFKWMLRELIKIGYGLIEVLLFVFLYVSMDGFWSQYYYYYYWTMYFSFRKNICNVCKIKNRLVYFVLCF